MNVTDTTFETDVLERSTQVPVVVDLWAEWCGPCKTLGPILEKVIAETGGEVELTKVDIDADPRVAQIFDVRSIPAVYAIKDRKIVDSFIGALPEPAVRQWVARLAPPPSEADLLVAKGDETSLRAALALEPGHELGVLELASLLVEGSDPARREEALALLARIPDSPEVRHLTALARLGGAAGGADTEGLEEKLDALLDRVKGDDAARQEFVDLLEVLGPDDPRTATYRRKLTARLF